MSDAPTQEKLNTILEQLKVPEAEMSEDDIVLLEAAIGAGMTTGTEEEDDD